MAHFYQKFGKREYRMGDSYATKREAQQSAGSLRRSGNYWAIIRPVGKRWVVYRAVRLKGQYRSII